MNFDNDEDIMKAINAGGGVDMDVDDELAALEAEVHGGKPKGKKKKKDGDDLSLSDLSEDEEEQKPQKKHEKHASDDDLAALEKEGFDDLEDEEEKPKQVKKSQPQPQPQPQPKKQTPPPQPQKKPEPQINKQELAKAMQAKQSQKSSSGVDLYPEKVEKKYHDVQKMTSLGVLEKEKEICDKIIQYKKKRDEDFDTWDFKKESIDDKISLITSTIQDGAWDFETYKKKIKEQYAWESKLLLFVEKDPSLNPEQKNVLKERVNNRKKIIEDELTRNPDEEAAEEEQKNPPPKEEKKPEPQPKQNPTATKPTNQAQPAAGSKGGDFYPEKVEKKYHSVDRMESLGVLEKEKEICDLIIGYKKKKGEDFDTWEFKKDSIDTRKDTITTSIENGIMDFEGYKKKIKSQYEWESKLLIFVDKDASLNDAQKKIIKERVNKRKKIIEEELTTNPEEQAGEEEPVKEEPKPAVKKKNPNLETKISASPMYNVPKDKEAETIKRLTEVVTDRLNEYRAAIDYFKNNELSEQQASAIKSAKAICIELKKIQDGKWKEVNEFSLPDPVTPEYIYGYSKEERMEKFKKIIKELSEQKKGVTNDYNARIESFKKLTKAQFKKIEAVAKKDLDALKSKKEKLEKIIKLLLEKAQDKWVPAPLYIETEEEIKVQKMNKDIPENTIRIIFGKTTYAKKDRLYLIVTVPEKKLEKKFDQKNPGDWTEQFDWKVEKADFKAFWKTKVHVEIYEKKTILKDKFKGQFDMEPRGLKDHSEYTNNYKIDLDSKREGQTACVTFKTRTPCKEMEYLTETKSIFQVTRIYPPFNIRGGNNTETGIKIEVNQPKVTADDLKVNNSGASKAHTPAPKVQKQATPTQGGKPKQGGGGGAAPAKKPGPPKAHIDKSEFKDEELKDPDCIDCLQTLQVLDFKLNKYEEIRNKIDGRTPRELMQRIIKIKCKKQTLTDALGDEISPQDYLTLLRTTFAHDKKLVDYFNQIKDAEKSKLVSERLPLIIKETEELMKQMPK